MKRKLILILSIFFMCLNMVDAEVVKFSDCVDGDTIKVLVNKKEYTVRMLAVDTPESVHPTKGVEYYGKEASEFTCNKVKNAKKLELEYDDNSDKEDKYGRLLAWVFVDGKLLQEELIKNGYAKVAYLYDNYKYTEKLESIQEKASAKNIGVWDDKALEEYNKKNNIEKVSNSISDASEGYSKWDILVIGVLLLVILFVGDKSIKNKAKKKLKNYLK